MSPEDINKKLDEEEKRMQIDMDNKKKVFSNISSSSTPNDDDQEQKLSKFRNYICMIRIYSNYICFGIRSRSVPVLNSVLQVIE